MSKFKVGDRVRVLSANHGWGAVSIGDVGVVSEARDTVGEYRVNFPAQSRWCGAEKCFELVVEDVKQPQPDEFVGKEFVYLSNEYGHQMWEIMVGYKDDGSTCKQYEFSDGGRFWIKDENVSPLNIQKEPKIEIRWVKMDTIIDEYKEKTIMSKVTTFVKNLALSKDERALRENGFKTETGEYTESAIEVVLQDLCKEREARLIEIANVIIEENKK